MVYETLLIDRTVKITSAIFKTWKVWKVQFNNGMEAILYKCGNIWVQRNEDNLTPDFLIVLGKYIDEIILGKIMPA